MPRRDVTRNPFRFDRRTYTRGQTARIVGDQVLLTPAQSIHQRSLKQLLGDQWDARGRIMALWPNQRINAFLQLLAEELGQASGADRDRLETLWNDCIGILQRRA